MFTQGGRGVSGLSKLIRGFRGALAAAEALRRRARARAAGAAAPGRDAAASQELIRVPTNAVRFHRIYM